MKMIGSVVNQAVHFLTYYKASLTENRESMFLRLRRVATWAVMAARPSPQVSTGVWSELRTWPWD